MPKSLYSEFLEIFDKLKGLSPEDALRELLTLIARDLGGNKALCAVYDKQNNIIKALLPTVGIEKAELITLFKFSYDRKSALKVALRKKSIYYTNDALNDPYFIKEFILSFDVTRVMLIPVVTTSGELFGAVYIAREKDFKEGEIKKGKKWKKLLYPLLSHILKIRETRDRFITHSRIISNINPAIAETDPENALSMLAKSILEWEGVCGIRIFLKEKDNRITSLINENNASNDECADPALVKTLIRETPISHNKTIEIDLSYNRLSSIASNINFLLNALSFTSSYLIHNREKHDLFMKFSLLFTLSEALGKVKTEEELAETLTKILFEYGNYEDVGYLKYVKKLKKLRLVSQFTIIGMNIYTNYEQPIDIGILGKAVKESKTIIVNDTKNNSDYYAGFPERNIFQSEAAIPLFYEGEPVAVLNLETTRKHAFTEEEQNFLKVIKEIVESKLSLILYENEVKRDRERLKALSKLIDEISPKDEQETILRKSLLTLQDVFGDNFILYSTLLDNGIITLKRSDGALIELHKKDQPEEMIKTFATKSPSLFEFGGYASVMIPLKECKERRALFVQKRTGEFTDTTIEFLVFAANFICKLMHNSILYKDLDQRLREFGYLYNFSREITEAKTQEELFEKTYNLIKSLFSVQDFYIALYSPEENSIYLEIDYDGDVKQRKRVIPLSKSQGLTAWIIKQRRPVMINDWDREALSYPIVPLGNKPHKSYIGIPLISENRVLGVIALQSPKKNYFSGHTLSLLSTIATQLSITLNNLNNVKKLKDLIERLENTYNETLEALSHALDYREEETEYHSKRVAEYAILLAKRYGIEDENKLRYIYWGGLLHDIGKIGIPDRILLKPGKLSEDEWNIMKKHVVIGYQILKGINFLRPALPLVLHHHEWWNGKGYPMGLREEEIPVEARIFSIVDAFDAMTSDRPYRKAMSYSKAISEIKRMRGIQFDPNVVDTFLSISFEELHKINPSLKKD